MSRPGTLAIFKNKGAAKFTQLPVRFNNNGWVDKNGAVLLECAPVVGTRSDGLPECDWNQKISFAIGVPDICQIVDPTKVAVKLFHKRSIGGTEVTKTLQFVPGTGKYEGTCQLYLSIKGDGADRQIFVPLSGGEYLVLLRLLVGSVPWMLNWGTGASNAVPTQN